MVDRSIETLGPVKWEINIRGERRIDEMKHVEHFVGIYFPHFAGSKDGPEVPERSRTSSSSKDRLMHQ